MTAVLNPLDSVNPATGQLVESYDQYDDGRIDETLERVTHAYAAWRGVDVEVRARLLLDLATELRHGRDFAARLATTEMGKPLSQSLAEVDKCIRLCEHYAAEAKQLLAPQTINVTDNHHTVTRLLPLGPVLGVMPWNFPYWQALRAAIPILLVGNTFVLKHAENVSGTALLLESVFRRAGFGDAFQSLLLSGARTSPVVSDDRIAGATLTGSERAGAAVAEVAGATLKPTLLELGGSDPFLVFADADVETAARVAVQSRFQNAGQTCIAAKRFILHAEIADRFTEVFCRHVDALRIDDPLDTTTDIGPMARADLREQLATQVRESLAGGAQQLTRVEPTGDEAGYYHPAIVLEVAPHNPVPCWTQETFGPVAAITRVSDEDEAIAVANATRYGLGSSIWSADHERAMRVGNHIHAGSCFINGMTMSDPCVPFGGVKKSGYGRELAGEGVRAFANLQAVTIVR